MADQSNAPVVTIESLQAELDTERQAHGATQAELALAKENYVGATAALSAAEVGKARAEAGLAEATSIIAGQKETITAQEARIIELQVTPPEFPAFTLNKVTYQVDVKHFKYKGVDYSVEQLLKDKDLQKELVEKGAGFLIKKEA